MGGGRAGEGERERVRQKEINHASLQLRQSVPSPRSKQVIRWIFDNVSVLLARCLIHVGGGCSCSEVDAFGEWWSCVPPASPETALWLKEGAA